MHGPYLHRVAGALPGHRAGAADRPCGLQRGALQLVGAERLRVGAGTRRLLKPVDSHRRVRLLLSHSLSVDLERPGQLAELCVTQHQVQPYVVVNVHGADQR